MPLMGITPSRSRLPCSLLRGERRLVAVSVLAGGSSLHLLGAFILTVRRYYL